MSYIGPNEISWSGFCSVKDKERIGSLSFIKRSQCRGYCADEVQTVNALLFAESDKTLLSQVLTNPNHTLHQLLPPINNHKHHLKKRPHQHQLPAKKDNSPTVKLYCSFTIQRH
jgi:hypothetical protein